MTGPLAELDLALFGVFTAGAFIAVSAIVLVAAHVPLRPVDNEGRSLVRLAGVVAAVAAALFLVAALFAAAPGLPFALAVISVGLAALWAPWLADLLPQTMRDSTVSLVLVAVLCVTAVALLDPGFLVF